MRKEYINLNVGNFFQSALHISKYIYKDREI